MLIEHKFEAQILKILFWSTLDEYIYLPQLAHYCTWLMVCIPDLAHDHLPKWKVKLSLVGDRRSLPAGHRYVPKLMIDGELSRKNQLVDICELLMAIYEL